MPDLVFPDGFLWGASTSSYQIEGGNDHADWRAWEHAGTRSDAAGDAADSWNRFREDVDLAVELGHSASTASRPSGRGSSRSRDVRRRGARALRRVARLRAGARASDDARALALHESRVARPSAAPGRRRRDACALRGVTSARRGPGLAPHVDWWATINEANTYANHGWLVGVWPPGRRNDYAGGFAVYRNLARGPSPRAFGDQGARSGTRRAVGLTHVIPWTHPAERGGRSLGACQCVLELARDLELPRPGAVASWTGSASSTTTTRPAARSPTTSTTVLRRAPTWAGGSPRRACTRSSRRVASATASRCS